MIRILGTILAGLAGLAFGSFLNVCLSRWPAGESVVKPRSYCRSCGRTLTWWENVPLVSWLALRGRCRICKTRISWRYPLVELAVGAIWALLAWQFLTSGLDPRLPVMLVYDDLATYMGKMIFYWLLIALAVLDAEHLWLPNFVTIPGIAIGFWFSLIHLGFLAQMPTDEYEIPLTKYGALGMALMGLGEILAAAGLILLIRWAYWLIRRREGIGLGDAKLMALLAAWLGLPGALLAFAIGVVLGSAVALVLLAIPASRRESETWALTKLPLGTFLCIGGIISGLWGQQIVAAYLRWSGLS
jgi:leader peptidase (prepilin peptidase) / N-methyltransferase